MELNKFQIKSFNDLVNAYGRFIVNCSNDMQYSELVFAERVGKDLITILHSMKERKEVSNEISSKS